MEALYVSLSLCNSAFQINKIPIYLKELQRKREIQRETLPIFWYIFQMAATAQGWARPKPGHQNFFTVSHISDGVPSTWVIFCRLLRHFGRELDQTWGSWDMFQMWDASVIGDSLTCGTKLLATFTWTFIGITVMLQALIGNNTERSMAFTPFSFLLTSCRLTMKQPRYRIFWLPQIYFMLSFNSHTHSFLVPCPP